MNLSQRLTAARNADLNSAHNAAIVAFQREATTIYGETRYVSWLVQSFTYRLQNGENIAKMGVVEFEIVYQTKSVDAY